MDRSNLRPKQTVPFLLSSHGLGMWAMMDYVRHYGR